MKITFWLTWSLLQFSLFVTRAFAQPRRSPGYGGNVPTPSPTTITLTNPLGCRTATDCINRVIDGLLVVAIPIASIMVLVGGFQLMMAGGDTEKVTRGRKTILYAAVGFAVVLLAKSVALIIQNILGAR